MLSSRGKPLDATRRTVLIVEDDPHLQRAMTRELARMDFQVLLAGHYDAAVPHLMERELHVACIDVGLPTKSGYELCEHIRGSLGLAGLPILMTGDYGSAQDRAYAEDAGGDAFLCKPFSMGQFAWCIESLSRMTRWGGPPVTGVQIAGHRPATHRYPSSRVVAPAGIVAA